MAYVRAAAAAITGSTSAAATMRSVRDLLCIRTMLRITSKANPHQPRSARLGLAGEPMIPNTFQASCPNSQHADAAAHSVQRLRSLPVAARRAMSVPITAPTAAAVQATSNHSAAAEVSLASVIATTANPAETATSQTGRGVLLTRNTFCISSIIDPEAD